MALSTHLLGWRSTEEAGWIGRAGRHRVAPGPYGSVSGRRYIGVRRLQSGDFGKILRRMWRIGFLSWPNSVVGLVGLLKFHACARGRGAGISEDIFIELYGSAGSAVFSLQDPWGLRVAGRTAAADPSCPLERREVPAELLKISGSPRDVAAHDPRWGYRYDQAWQFVESVRIGKARALSFRGWRALSSGARCGACLERDAKLGFNRRMKS